MNLKEKDQDKWINACKELSLKISVAFISVKRFIVLTLWQILQMCVNMLEGEKNKSHPARFCPLEFN